MARQLSESDQLAIDGYEQLVRSASDDDLLKVHTEAFAKLSPGQRELVYEKFLERAAADDEKPGDASAPSLAAAATRIEEKKPGTLRRLFDEAQEDPAYEAPTNSFYAAFAGYILGTELAYSLMLSSDAAAGAYGLDYDSMPDPNFGFDGGGLDGDGAGF